MTCEDCIKYDACWSYNGGMTRTMSMKNKAEKNCGHFKNKADYVEVVRCGKCKHWMYIGQGLDAVRIGKCCNDNFPFHCEQRPIMKEDDFCSYGVKKTATDIKVGSK